MPDRLLAIFLIGHATDGDYSGWLRQRLTYARVDLDELSTTDGRGRGSGVWAGMPCHVRHLDDVGQGPLLLSFDRADFETAMKLPPTDDYQLPPPLATFADACQALGPNVALLTVEPLDEAEVDRYATELAAETNAGPSAELCERRYSALFLGSFDLVMLEDEQPLLAVLDRHDVAGGAVFLGTSAP